jgi:hypothetical protein
VKDAEFYHQLGSCGWLALVAKTLNVAAECCHFEMDQSSLVERCLSRILSDAKFRTCQGLLDLVEKIFVPSVSSNLMVLGADHPICIFAAKPQIANLWLFLDCVYQMTLQCPSEFEMGEDFLRMILLEIHQRGALSREFLKILVKCGKPGVVLAKQGNVLEPITSIWQLQLWRWLFLSVGTSKVSSNNDEKQEISVLRETVGRLMLQLSAQEAVLVAKKTHHEDEHVEAEKEGSVEEIEKQEVVVRPTFHVSGGAQVIAEESPTPFRIKPERERVILTPLAGEQRPMFVPTPEHRRSAAPLIEEVESKETEHNAAVISKLRQSVAERGEKLELVADASQEMETNSKSLRDMAQELNQKQQAKQKRWGLF